MESPSERCTTTQCMSPHSSPPAEGLRLLTSLDVDGKPCTQQSPSTYGKGKDAATRRGTEPQSPRRRTSKRHKPSLSLDRIFTPRPLDIILSERAYLISSLNRQSSHSRQLIVEYSAVELQFSAPGTHGKARRRLRKKLGSLRTQLDEAAEQEKIIFMRLGEVYTELQSHAAWAEAALWRIPLQQDHRSQGHVHDRPDRCFAGYAPPSSEEPCHGPNGTPLDPTLPMFVPGQPIYAFSDTSSAMRFTSDLSNPSPPNVIAGTSDSGCHSHHHNPNENDDDLDGDGVYDYDFEDENVSPGSQRTVSEDPGCLSPREKRLSLPCMPSIWPEG